MVGSDRAVLWHSSQPNLLHDLLPDTGPELPPLDGASMKPLILGVAVLFVGFWMVQAPDSLATFTKEGASWLWDTTSMVFSSVLEFLDNLTS